MLVLGASKHGMHSVTKLMEEVFHHAGGEEGRGASCGRGEIQLQHDYRQLVTAVCLLAPATNCEVTVLNTSTVAHFSINIQAAEHFWRDSKTPEMNNRCQTSVSAIQV